MAWLALLLFLPWFAVLGSLFWYYPRQPRTRRRRWTDAAWLAAALLASGVAVSIGHASAGGFAGAGPIWAQVLAVLYGYGAFLAVLVLGLWLRRRCW